MAACVRLGKYTVTVVILCFLLLILHYHPAKVHVPHHATASPTTRQTNTTDKAPRDVITLPLFGVKNHTSQRMNCNTLTMEEDRENPSINGTLLRMDDQSKSQSVDEKMLRKCSVQVHIAPCSCTRTLQARVTKSCLQGANNLFERIIKDFGDSTCSDLATLRGGGQQVVSFSVFGEFPSDYHLGIEKLLPRIRHVYPEWSVRVYVDASHPSLLPWMCHLACRHPHLDFCDIKQLPNVAAVPEGSGYGWRMGVVGDRLVTRYMLRDSDSPILIREVHAVRQWLSSGTCYHIMRDHLQHKWVMMAGMWGGCNTWQRAVGAQVGLHAICVPTHDQSFLKARVWPVARLNATIHDSYTCRRFPGSQPFPSRRVNYTFVGQRSYRGRYRWETTHQQCPFRCRPNLHQDWLYC